MNRTSASLPLALAAALWAAPAAAADPVKGAAPNATEPESEAEAEAGPKRAAPPDDRTGHIYFGAHGLAMGPAGAMGPNTSSTSLAAVGYGAGGFFGIGVGRSVTLQAFGDWTKLISPGSCSGSCGGKTFSVGLGVTYHIAQALGFDPWASYGIAFRRTSFNVVAPQYYQGIDIARLAIGGDFYPTSVFGFGIFLEADLGTNFRWADPLEPLPPDVHDGPRTYALFQAGFRVAFDPMRKAVNAGRRDARRGLAFGF